ncbi:MAG: HPr family phosphocarrier protein [Vulcanimicrobiaceae bacterium]|jgi:phosphotransferase system HPr (HPr) family protein
MKRVVEEVVVTDPLGIHARPAAALAMAVSKSGARVTLRLGAKSADAKSLIQLLSLGAAAGSHVSAEIEGEDEAIAAVIGALREQLAPAPA